MVMAGVGADAAFAGAADGVPVMPTATGENPASDGALSASAVSVKTGSDGAIAALVGAGAVGCGAAKDD